MSETIIQRGDFFTHQTDDIAVATPITILIPNDSFDISITVATDIAGTGTIDITGSIGGSPDVTIGATVLDIAAITSINIDRNVNSLTFTPNSLATATTYKIYVAGRRTR